jgi:leucyl aminopeptidase (aminopeptidase T)
VESSLNGELVCDVAIGGIGPIRELVIITVEDGKVRKVVSDDKEVLKKVKDSLFTDDWGNVVGEFAFGINPRARLVEEFLEDEKILGTIHIAFGHNLDMPGGRNASKNHIDLQMSKPTVRVEKADGTKTTVLESGKFKDL